MRPTSSFRIGSALSQILLRRLSLVSGLEKGLYHPNLRRWQSSLETTKLLQTFSHPAPARDELSDEQRAILKLVLEKGENVFFTGPAGTGKSFLLRQIIQGLVVTYLGDSSRSIAVTASTGLAASSIGGTTLHRFAGIGLGKAPTDKLIEDICEDRRSKLRRWLDVKVLIIDEVSMIDSTLFNKLDVIARAVRGVDQPFGGIQLVITGDFFQLPPVLERSDDGSQRFCFEAKAWKNAVQHTITLTKIYRQKDPTLAGMLNEIREGIPSPKTISTFRRLHRPLTVVADKGQGPAELFPLRREADLANAKRMQQINSKVYKYAAQDGGLIADPDTRTKLLSTCPASRLLELKQGAQVMLVKNIDQTLVNGSQGKVIGFTNEHTFFHNVWGDGEYSEGRETEQEITDSITTMGAPEKSLPLYPVVQFCFANGRTRTKLCAPTSWDVERWVREPWHVDGWRVETLATRTQVPLILAWALSIHKAQGQTLELVRVDLKRVFERGQAYVALSRVSSMEGLQVLNFDPNKVKAHPKVKAFYATLSSV